VVDRVLTCETMEGNIVFVKWGGGEKD